MKCDFVVGEPVVSVAEEFSTCSHPHSEEDGWEINLADVGRYYIIEDIFMDENGHCVMLCFHGDPYEHCSGTFRRLEKADDSFIALVKKIKEDA